MSILKTVKFEAHRDEQHWGVHVTEDSGAVAITIDTGGSTYYAHLSREEAMRLSQSIDDVISAYDATVDRYHEVCDEPVAAEVR